MSTKTIKKDTTKKKQPKKEVKKKRIIKKHKQAKILKSQFESLCAIQCTETEICGVLGVTKPTLISWCKETYGTDFLTIFKQKRELGRASLRRTQLKLAEKSATMSIWLGKQYLDQKDEIDIKAEHKADDELLNAINSVFNNK